MPQPSCCSPSERDLVHVVQEVGWAPGPVFTGVGNLTRCNPQTIQPVESRYNWLHYHSLWLFKEWIYLYAFGCVVIQFLLFFATPHLFLFFTPMFTPCKKVFLFCWHCIRSFWQGVYISFLTILAPWVRFYHFLPVALCVKKTILPFTNSFED